MEWIQLLETLVSPLNKNFIVLHRFHTTFFRKQSCDQIEPLCFFCFLLNAYIQILHGQKPYGASFTKYFLVLFQDVTFILQTGCGNSQAYQLEGVNLM